MSISGRTLLCELIRLANSETTAGGVETTPGETTEGGVETIPGETTEGGVETTPGGVCRK